LNEIDRLEKELLELRQRFAQSIGVLEELSQIRSQFAALSHTHEALQANLEKTKQFLETLPAESGGMDKRFLQLESQFEVRHEQIQAQLTNFRFDFDAMTRQLREEIQRRSQDLKRGEISNGELATSGEEADRLQWLESSLQHLNASLYSEQANVQKLDRRVTSLKRNFDIMAIAGFVSGLVLFMAFFITK
jgi:chromosome segregation ATPase